MQQPPFTLVGNVVSDPQLRVTKDGVPVANFRMASTPSRYDGVAGQWRDGETIFMGVTCWRSMAQNVQASMHKGDPVVVTGKLAQHSFEGKDGQLRTSYEIEAIAVGPDLSRGTAKFTRTRSSEAAGTTADLTPEQDEPSDAEQSSGSTGIGSADEPDAVPAEAAA
ncbi:MAG: single-stranded DNA-binding protein [Mycobacteriales bacterium]